MAHRKYDGHNFYNLKELFKDTILLNTGSPGLESWQSAQKKPFLTNWKLS